MNVKRPGEVTRSLELVVISGGTGDPSSTRLLAGRLAEQTVAEAGASGLRVRSSLIELRPLATDIAQAIVAGFPSDRLREVIETVARADGLIVATPVYQAGVSGLVKSFIDLLDADLLIATPVLLAATAGSARHALVVDGELRSLFAYLRAASTPTGVFAAPEDWGTSALTGRIERSAHELVGYLSSGVRDRIRGTSWQHYRHEFGGHTSGDDPAAAIDFDSDLMRLAAGGSAR